MKVKKALSLVLALVMVLTLIPVQLVTSAALNEDTVFGNNTRVFVDVSEYDSGEPGDEMNGLIDVALNVEIDYDQIQADAEAAGIAADKIDNYKKITVVSQVVRFDPAVLSTVSAADADFAQPNMEAVMAKAASGPIAPGTDYFVESTELLVKSRPKTTVTFGLDAASKLAVANGKVYVRLAGSCSGFLPSGASGKVTHTIGHLYLAKASDSVTYAQVASAIKIPDANDTAADGAPNAVSGDNICMISSTGIANCTAAGDDLYTDNLPADPAVTWEITFTGMKDADGNAVQDSVQTVNQGEQPVAPTSANYKTVDKEYTFDGWTTDGDTTVYTADTIPVAAAAVIYTAHYADAPRQYSILFQDWDGTGLQVSSVAYGENPNYIGTTPTRAEDADNTYEFVGWTCAGVDYAKDATLPAVTGDATYIAKYDATPKAAVTHKVTFVINRDTHLETLQEGQVAVNTVPTYNGETPTKQADAQYTYTFAGWKDAQDAEYPVGTDLPAVGDEDVVYTAYFTAAERTYTITWKNANGAVLKTEVLAYGETPTAPEAVPTQDATEQYTYSFKAWDKEIATVTEDATYTATYEEHLRTYTVTFVNDGDILQTGPVEYGTVPTYNGLTPERAATAQYTYTFTGWDPEVVAVTGEATYTAQYSEAVNPYTVKFVNEDTAVLQEDPVNYGTAPAYNGETPTKNADKQYTYTFAGWEDAQGTKYAVGTALPEVTGEATYTAYYESTLRQYEIIFQNWDGTELQKETLDYGTMPEYKGATPTKPNEESIQYTFTGWTPQIKTVEDNETYVATFSESPIGTTTVAIRFENEDGSLLATYDVPAGTVPVYNGATPTKDGDAQYTYTFKGWMNAQGAEYVVGEDLPVATEAATYTAFFDSSVNTYTVYWIVDGQTVETDEGVAYGTTPTYDGAEPTKEATDQFTYNFTGWNPEVGPIEGDTRYVAQFGETTNTYTVTWIVEGQTVETDTDVPYGTVPTYDGAVPSKEATAQYTYNFTGWSPEVEAITGNTTYTAQFSETTRTYTVTWVVNGQTAETDTDVPYGTVPTYDGAVPTKEATTEKVFTFTGWDPEVVAVTSEATYTAQFSDSARPYTITFENYDGTKLQSGSVAYGETPVYSGQQPEKPQDAQYTYSFKDWGEELAPVTGDKTYTAQFDSFLREYTITFADETGENVYTSGLVAYGQTPSYTGAEPTKESTAQYNYAFSGWTPELTAVTGDATYKAVFTPQLRSYDIKFTNGETVLQTINVPYGEVPVYTGPTPIKDADAENTYTFDGWVKTRSGVIAPDALPAVTGEADYNAHFASTPIEYTVKFMVDGEEYNKQTLHYGDPVVVPEKPTKAPSVSTVYTFANWTPAVDANCQGNAEYTAVFNETPRTYTITVVTKSATDASTVTDTMDVAFGETPEIATPATGFVVGNVQYDFTGWDKEITPVAGEETYTAQYTETPVTATTYTINFQYADNASQAESKQYADHTVTVQENTVPSAPTTPANFETETMTYEFTGWDKEIVAATGDAVYVAQYKETPKETPVTTYEITFRYADNDGKLVDETKTVNAGEMPEAPSPENYTKGNTTYVFQGWDKEIVAAEGDATYTARYNPVKDEDDFIPDMTEIEKLEDRYDQMVKTGNYNKDDLAKVKDLIDDIYDLYDDNAFTSQDEIDAMAKDLKDLEDACRLIEDTKKEEKKETSKITKRSTSPRTGDNASLVVMSVILISSLGLAIISLKKKRENI